MLQKNGIWERIGCLGIREGNNSVSNAIFRTNQLSIVLFGFTSFFFSIHFYLQEFTIAVSLLLAAFLFVSTLVFTAVELTKLSRFMLSFLIVPVMSIPLFAFGEMESANFKVWLYSAIATSTLPLFVFSRKNEKGAIALGLFFNISLLFSFQYLFMLADVTFYDSIAKGSYGISIPPQLNVFSVTLAAYALFDHNFLAMNKSQVVEEGGQQNDLTSQYIKSKHEQYNGLAKLKSLLNAHRVSVYIEKEIGVLELSEEIQNKDLPVLNKTFRFSSNDGYDAVLSTNQTIVFDVLNDTRTREFYSDTTYDYQVLASLEIPFFNGLTAAGVVRCEVNAGKAQWTNHELSEATKLVKEHTSHILINPRKAIQTKEQFEEQKKLILNQNNELKQQQKELEKALKKQKETQQELATKEAEARSLLKSISDHNYVFEYNRRGDIIWLNEKSLGLFDMTLEEVRGMNWSEFDLSFVQGNGLEFNLGQSFWRDLLAGKSIKRETRVSVKGTETWVAATFLPILDEYGKPVRILGIAQDITDIHDQREQIKEQNQLLVETQEEVVRINNDLEKRVKERTQEIKLQKEQLVEYTYINAHMLRAPVCNILGLVELLDNSDVNQENKDVINFLHKAAFELDDIVSKINETLREGYNVDRNAWKNKANKAILSKELEA